MVQVRKRAICTIKTYTAENTLEEYQKRFPKPVKIIDTDWRCEGACLTLRDKNGGIESEIFEDYFIKAR